MGNCVVKNAEGKYFVEWETYDKPVFREDKSKAKHLSETGAENLVELLSSEGFPDCSIIGGTL